MGDLLRSALFKIADNGAGPNDTPSTSAETQTQFQAQSQTQTMGSENQAKKSSTSANATPTTTPTNPPLYGFAIPNGKPPCVPLKQSIDMLSNMAHNFATMMDPFAAYMDQNSNTNDSAAAATTTASATATAAASSAANDSLYDHIIAAVEADRSARIEAGRSASVEAIVNKVISVTESASTAASAAATAAASVASNALKEAENVLVSVTPTAPEQPAIVADPEPMADINTDQQASVDPKDIMIVDCSDDEEEDLRNLVTSLTVNQNSSLESNKKDENSASIENG